MKIIKAQLKSDRHMTFKKYGSEKSVYLLLHGIPGSSHAWHKVATDLAKEGVTVHVPDLLGFGQSSRPSDISDLWLEAQAQALAESLEQFDIESIHLVGHDYGGPISITLYWFYPVFTDTQLRAG